MRSLLSGGLLGIVLMACHPTVSAPVPARTRPAVAVAERRGPSEDGEPRPPVVECSFERRERCVPETPTRTALQPHPFHFCPRTLPALAKDSVYPVAAAYFSAAASRQARVRDLLACCYVELVARACR